MCADIRSQAQRALISPEVPKAVGGLLHSETLVVIHTCGNDFIMKMAEAFMGGGLGFLGGGGSSMSTPEMLQPNPGVREVGFMKEFLESMHRAGARHFLVSGVPIFLDMPVFNMALPIITGMVNAGKLEALGVSPGDPPRLAVEVQASALHERWEELVKDFSQNHADSICIFFDEVAALERLRLSFGEAVFDRSMWDFSMFHPTAWGHDQLAVEAQKIVIEKIPTISGAPAMPSAKAKASSEAKSSAYSGSAPKAAQVQSNALPMKVHVRNVKGDVAFEVTAESSWTTARFREEVLSKAPSGFSDANSVCVFAMKGKFLGEGTETLEKMGLHNGGQVIAVIKPKSAPIR